MKKIISILVLICVLASALVSCGDSQKPLYENALMLLEEGKYEEAKEIFEELGDYEDAEEYLTRFHYFVEKMSTDYATMKISFNENNLPSKMIATIAEGTNYITTLTYDNMGNILNVTDVDHNGDTDTYDYTYDEDGNLIKAVTPRGEVTYEYTYDDEGHVIKEIETSFVYEEENKSIYDYVYDDDGNLIKEVRNYSYGSTTTIDYIYDDDGNKIKEVYSDGGDKSIGDYTYDENGNLIKYTYHNDRTPVYANAYRYDENGNMIEITSIDVNTGDTRYTRNYTYDENGNLVKIGEDLEYTYRLVYVPFDLPEATVEKIEYLLDRE